MRLSMIAALGKNRVIGNKNKMPWHLPADLQFFKKTTMGKPIIMGRKTYDSIGRPLPGRLNIVLSRDENLTIDGCTVVNSLQEAMLAAEDQDSDEIFITGGAYLYNTYLADADRLYLTLIDEEFEGDTFFPDYTQYDWKQIRKQTYRADVQNLFAYSFVTLDRVR